MFDKAKRKNNEKSKGHPALLSRGQLMMLTLIPALIIGSLMVWGLQSPAVDNSQFPRGRLTYTSDGQRYALNLQINDRAVISPAPRPADIPHVSPDGQWVAFWRIIPQTNDAELIMQETQKPETQRSLGLFTGPLSGLNWSADNDHLVFSAHFNFERPEFCLCDHEIYLVSRITGEHKRLTVNANLESDPVFSPDGTQIVYTSALDNYNRLYIMDMDCLRHHII
jgi:Tol biopolymer transport system component